MIKINFLYFCIWKNLKNKKNYFWNFFVKLNKMDSAKKTHFIFSFFLKKKKKFQLLNTPIIFQSYQNAPSQGPINNIYVCVREKDYIRTNVKSNKWEQITAIHFVWSNGYNLGVISFMNPLF